MLTKEQREIRILQIDQRLSRLSKITSRGRDEGLQALFDEFMDERDSLVCANMEEA